jgi:hypothetical protein
MSETATTEKLMKIRQLVEQLELDLKEVKAVLRGETP